MEFSFVFKENSCAHCSLVISLFDRHFANGMSARGGWLRKIIEDERKSMISTKNTDAESKR